MLVVKDIKPSIQTMTKVSAQPKKRMILSLQSMRLFAALGVFQFHLWHNYLGVIFGHPGTDFFFVLVGVVAALVQAKRIPDAGWKSYIQARYIRIYITYIPLFLIVLAFKWHEGSLGWVLRSFFFLPMTSDQLPVIGSSWMISSFMLFYYIFSIAFIVRRESVLWPIFTVWFISIILYTWFNWRYGLPDHWAWLLFNERNLEFIFGYLAGMILRERKVTIYWGRWLFWIGMIGIVAGTVLININVNENTIGRSLFLGLPIAIFVFGLVVLEQQGATDYLARMLTKPGLVWLGGTSYVLYITHGIYLQAWSRLLPVTPILIPIITVGALCISSIGYFLWESPLLRYSKKVLKK